MRKGKEGKVPVTMALAREETETALNVCIQHVLDRTGLQPHQVGPCRGLPMARWERTPPVPSRDAWPGTARHARSGPAFLGCFPCMRPGCLG